MPISNPETDRIAADGSAAERTVLVLGATGNQGGAVARALLAKGRSVRALVRDPANPKARALSALGVELSQGDLSDPASLRKAMTSVWGVFSVQPNSGQGAAGGPTDQDEFRYGAAVADLAVELGVGHLVYSSAFVVSQGPTGVPNLDVKLEVEDHIRSLDLRSTVIRPATFMELLVQPGMAPDQGVFSFFMQPDEPGLFIAAEDIGKIVAAIFGDPEGYAGKAIEIAGDAPTGEDLGKAFSAALGQPVRYQRYPDDLLAANPALGRPAKVFAEGRARHADLEGLRQEFGDLLTFEEWLARTGAPLLQATLKATETPLATH